MSPRQNSYTKQFKDDQNVHLAHHSTVPPKKTAFVHKLYAMLSDPSLSHLIWWSRKDDDCVFALHPGTEFASVLTNYFKHGNVSSFVRQLHMYGFHKVFDTNNDLNNDNDRNDGKSLNDDLIWEFRHSTGHFRKGDEASLALIKRRSSNKVVSDEDLTSSSPVSITGAVQYYYPVSRYMVHPNDLNQINHSIYPKEHYVIQQQTRFMDPNLPPGLQQAVPYHQIQPHAIVPYTTGPPGYEHVPRSSTSHHSSSLPQQVRNISTATPPEQRLEELSNAQQAMHDLGNQQRVIAVKSDHLNSEIRSTVSDVLKFSDAIPKVAPMLRNANVQHQEELNSIQHNFYNRAEQYRLSPLSNNQHPQQWQNPHPHAPRQQQQPASPSQPTQHEATPQVYIVHHPQNPSAPLVNPFVSPFQQHNDSINFWEGSVGRQPSVFVDPLNSSPNASVSGPSNASHSSAAHTHNTHIAPPTSQISPKPSISRDVSSLPHIHYKPSLSQQGTQKRNDSFPNYFSRHNPPRSVPEEYNNKTSIPNINHLTSQLRPSVHEILNHNQGMNTNANTSISSQSTFNSALYSHNSSISSISSRNSQGSFSGLFPAGSDSLVQHPHPKLNNRGSTNSLIGGRSTPPTPHLQSSATIHRDSIISSRTSTPSDGGEKANGGKLAVSSLLSSPGKSSRRDDDGVDSPKSLKKVKSVSHLR